MSAAWRAVWRRTSRLRARQYVAQKGARFASYMLILIAILLTQNRVAKPRARVFTFISVAILSISIFKVEIVPAQSNILNAGS